MVRMFISLLYRTRKGVAASAKLHAAVMTRLLILFASAVTSVVLVTMMLQPIHPDEGVFLTIGKYWSANFMPYLDMFDHKPPGVYVMSKALTSAVGVSIFAHRLFMLATALGVGSLVYLLLRRWLGRTWAFAGVLQLLILWPWYHGNFFITEPFMMFCILAGLWLMYHAIDSKQLKWSFASGCAFGAALLFKQVAMLNVLVLLAYFVVKKDRRGLYLFLGAMVAGLIPILYFGQRRALWAAWDALVVFNIRAYPAYPLAEMPRTFLQLLWPALAWALMGVVGLFAIENNGSKLVKIMFLAGIPMVFFRPYHQYWLQLLPFAVIITQLVVKRVKKFRYLMLSVSIVLGIYYAGVSVHQGYPLLKRQLIRLQGLESCERMQYSIDHYFTDCQPDYLFYTPDRASVR